MSNSRVVRAVALSVLLNSDVGRVMSEVQSMSTPDWRRFRSWVNVGNTDSIQLGHAGIQQIEVNLGKAAIF